MKNTEGIKGVHVTYALTVFDGHKQVTNDTVDIYASEGRSRILTGNSQIFQDQTMSLAIIAEQNLVYVQDPVSNTEGVDFFTDASVIQDSILTRASSISCRSICLNEARDANEDVYRVKPDQATSAYTEYDLIIFKIDPKIGFLKRVDFLYTEGHNPSQVTMSFIAYDMQYAQDVLEGQKPADILARIKARDPNKEVIDLRKK
ncbi:MAG: hypothetical protein AAF363_07850 [Bacteroidota bacterium]